MALNADFLSLSQASQAIPGRPHICTVFRWITRGCGGVKLKAVKAGTRWKVPRTELARFMEELTKRSGGEMPDTTQSPKQRQLRVKRAELALAKDGI